MKEIASKGVGGTAADEILLSAEEALRYARPVANEEVTEECGRVRLLSVVQRGRLDQIPPYLVEGARVGDRFDESSAGGAHPDLEWAQVEWDPLLSPNRLQAVEELLGQELLA